MNQLFKIFSITTLDAGIINSSPEEPHNHDFEEYLFRDNQPCINQIGSGK